jgi:hypothetical protein
MWKLPPGANRKEMKMGYSIRIKRADGGDAVLPEKHDIAGGTYAVGGTRDAWLYVTYNYAGTFHRVIGGEGLRSLDGGCVRDSLPVLDKAIAALGEAQPDADYWKATDGNAKKALVDLKAIADLALQAFPDERLTWEVE